LKQESDYDPKKLIFRYVSINVKYTMCVTSFWYFDNEAYCNDRLLCV